MAGNLAIVADVAHVIAAALWTGGLGFLFLALKLAKEDRWPLATRAVPRFSNMAVISVVVLLVAGIINGYLQVRTWSALWETEYGLLLLGKVALVLPLLALGAYNNRYAVPRLKAGIASVLERRRFLRAAGVELGIMVAIVAVTAVLVNAEPARTEAAMEMEEGAHTEEPTETAGRPRGVRGDGHGRRLGGHGHGRPGDAGRQHDPPDVHVAAGEPHESERLGVTPERGHRAARLRSRARSGGARRPT